MAASPRSVVWVGGSEEMVTSQLVASPLFDIAWCPTVAEALRLPLSAFDGVILPGRRGAAKLLAAGARIVVNERDPDPGRMQEVLGAGAREAPGPGVIPRNPRKPGESPP